MKTEEKLKTNIKIKPSNIILTCCILFLLNNNLSVENKLDSLKLIWENPKLKIENRFKAINQFYFWNTYNNPVVSMPVFRKHIELANLYKNNKELNNANNEMALAFSLQRLSDSSKYNIEQSIENVKKTNDSLQLAILYFNHGSALCEGGKLEAGIKRFYESAFIFEKFNERNNYLSIVYNNLGLVYSTIGLYEIAINYFFKSLEVKRNLKRNDTGEVYLNIGLFYNMLDCFKIAKFFFNNSIQLLTKENDSYLLSIAYLTMADLYKIENCKDSVFYHYHKSIKIRNEVGNPNLLFELYENKIKYNLSQNIAIKEEDKAMILNLYDYISDFKLKASGSKLLYQIFKLEGDEFQAFEMLEKYVQYTDSVTIDSEKHKIIKKDLQSDYSNKATTIKIERIIAQEKLDKMKKIFFIFLVIFTLVILIIIIFVRKTLIKNEKERNNLLQEIEELKINGKSISTEFFSKFELDRLKLESHIGKKLNETDWNVLNMILEEPTISNKNLALRVFLSQDGVGSSLRRMYLMFDVPESKYMKIILLLNVVKISNS